MTDAPIPGSRTLSEEEIDGLLHAIAEGFRSQLRAPVLHTPDEEGLDFEDVTFPSSDGVPLEGWFIPAPVGTAWPRGPRRRRRTPRGTSTTA